MLAVADEVWYRGTRCVNEISRIDPTMNLPSFFASPSRLYPTRRDFFRRTGGGLGMLALAGLLDQQGLLTAAEPVKSLNPLAARPSHFRARAKSVIWLFMNGGPSQVDTWDYKPELAKHDG